MYFRSRNLNQFRRKFKARSKTLRLSMNQFIFISQFHRVFIGIKKLLDLIDMARYTEPQNRVIKFLTKLEDEGGLDACANPSN